MRGQTAFIVMGSLKRATKARANNPKEVLSPTTMYANAGSVDITPDTPMPLFGNSLRVGNFQAVADRLEANVLVLRTGDRPLVCVSADLAFVGQDLRSCVLDRLGDTFGHESLFFAASHTHFAPATDDRRPLLGRAQPEYIQRVCRLISDLISRLLAKQPEPVTMDYVAGTADHAVNRRLRTPWHLSRRGPQLNAVVGAPDLNGPRDESVHLIRVRRAEGGLLALIWSYACHPVSFPRPFEVSSDYPGRVRQRLRSDLGRELPILFWQGFAGDIRPRELARYPSLRSRAKRVLIGPRFGRFSIPEWDRWVESLTACVAQIAASHRAADVTGEIISRRVSRRLREFVAGKNDDREVAFHGIRLGDRLAVIGVSAEPVAQYGPMVRRVLAGFPAITVGYIDDVFGYLPTSRMLDEGGYEVTWFLESFGLDGPLHPEIERHCMDAVAEVAAALEIPHVGDHG